MENFQKPNFDVLKAISVLTKKLEKSHLKIKRTNEFNNAEEKLRLCQLKFAISFLKKASNPSCCVKQNLLLNFY